MTTPATSTPGLIDWLYKLAASKDRGRLAALRRGLLLEPHQMFELYRTVPAPFLENVSAGEVRRRLMIAALFASHQLWFGEDASTERRRNLGDSMRLLAVKQHGGPLDPEEGPPEPLKRRMDALLAAHSDELFGHLRQVIRLLKTYEIPIDWARLLWDWRRWDDETRSVQWDWSRSFYVGYRNPEPARDE